MKIRILKQPIGLVEGIALNYYRTGHIYEVVPTLANYLVAEGFATFDLRDPRERKGHLTEERRKKTP